jgi:hypothetical protein
MIVETLIPAIASILDRVLPNEEARDKAKLELLSLQNTQELKLLEMQISAIVAEANSTDPWTSRARPTFLYLMYAVLSLCFMAGILGVWYPVEISIAASNVNAMFMAIPDSLYALFGTGYLGYTGFRSLDKRTEAVTKQPSMLPWLKK